MTSRWTLALAASVNVLVASAVAAQDLGPNFHKLKDGIDVYVGNDRGNDQGLESNSGIIITNAGVIVIDSGQTPTASRAIEAGVKKLTQLPVRYLISTETHGDHHAGDFLFSPPAVFIAHEGTAATLRDREPGDPARVERLRASSPEMRAALEGYHYVVPQIEYREKMTLTLGERTMELLYLKNAHSEADTAVWLPKERVLFSASVAVNNQFNVLRPWNDIPDVLADIKMLKALNPDVVVPGHGAPGTVKIFEDQEQFYALLVSRVDTMVRAGKSLDQIKKELQMPEYSQWSAKDRLPANIDAAYAVALGRLVYKGD